jgi:hypothetical protein
MTRSQPHGLPILADVMIGVIVRTTDFLADACVRAFATCRGGRLDVTAELKPCGALS